MAVIIGEGSYGKILYNKDSPNTVSKIHYLSSYENETGCDEIFEHEYKFHNLLYQTLLANSVSHFIIPKPINYKRETQIMNACIYSMEKMQYPISLENFIKPEKVKNYIKTNPNVHAPPYLLYSATTNDYENGKVKLTDMHGIEKWNQLFFTADPSHLSWLLGQTMITQFFNLTFESQIILQDVEFVLTEKNKELCVGLIDFNQVSDFNTRYLLANKRVPNYSLDYDIANTYLFLSGIDTGFMLTDRNTQWKFLPTPHSLPHMFFRTIQNIQNNSINNIVSIICSHIYQIELNAINTDSLHEVFDKIMVWHEILIYGAIDTTVFDKLNINYKNYDETIVNNLISNYTYFSEALPFNLTYENFDDYYILSSNNDQLYLERIKQKQNIGLISKNMINSVVYYDIMFQRLFILKCLLIVGITNVKIKKFKKMLETNVNFETLIFYILHNKKQKTRKTKQKQSATKTRKHKHSSSSE